MSISNHNETFKLLNATESESPSDVPEFTAPKRKIKVKRKFRPSNNLIKNNKKLSCTIWRTIKWLGLLSICVFLLVTCWFLYCFYEKINVITQRLQDLLSSRNGKKMKKRKELNALVTNGKSRCTGKKLSAGGVNNCLSSQELLNNDCSETTDTEESSAIRARKSLNGRKASRLYVACMPLCILTLVTASVVGTAMLIWMHLGLRQEVDMLRIYIRKVESGTRKTPEEFHIVHSRLNLLEGNSTMNRGSIAKLSDNVLALSKDIENLRKTTDSLSKSIAAAPQIESLPQTVQTLQQNVASLGSRITNLETTVNEMKDQESNSNKDMQTNVDNLQKKVESLSNLNQLQMTSSQPSVLYGEELQRMSLSLDELNRTTVVNFLKVYDELHLHQEKIAVLQNETIENSSNLDVRVKRLEEIPPQINEIVQERVNETFENFLLSGSNETYVKNVTVKQLLANLQEIPKLYNELLTKNSQYKQGEEEVTDNDHALSTTPVQTQREEELKNLTNQVDQMAQNLNILKSEQSTASTELKNLVSNVQQIRKVLNRHDLNSTPYPNTKSSKITTTSRPGTTTDKQEITTNSSNSTVSP